MYFLPLALLLSACSKEKSIEFDANNPGTGGPGTGGGGTDYDIGAVYNPNSQTIVYSNLIVSPTDPLKIVITSLSNTEMDGTFKGTLYEVDTQNPGATNPPTKVISEGEFKAKF